MWSRAAIEVAVEPDVDVPAVGGEWMDSLPPEPGLEQRNPQAAVEQPVFARLYRAGRQPRGPDRPGGDHRAPPVRQKRHKGEPVDLVRVTVSQAVHRLNPGTVGRQL